MRYWELSIQPPKFGKFQLEIKFGSVRPDYLGPPLEVVNFDQSTHFGRLDRNVPFYLTKLLFPVLLFCILLTRTIPRCAVAWVLVSVSGTYHFIGQVEFPKFQTGKFLLNRKHSLCLILHRAVVIATIPACNNFTVRVNTELLTA